MTSLVRLRLLPLLALLALPSSMLRAETTYQLTIQAGDQPRRNVPVVVDLAVPESLGQATRAKLITEEGRDFDGQLTAPSLLSKPLAVEAGQVHRQLCFLLESLDAGKSLSLDAQILDKAAPSADSFAWQDTAGKYSELSYAGRPLLRYMYEAIDESSGPRREETYKVFHHVYDPSGKQLVTKGAGGQFTHHRGLFYGFNRIRYGENKQADTWHCTGKAHLSHDGLVQEEAGPVLGRHRVKIGWHGQDGEVIANEEREMTVYRQPVSEGNSSGTLIEFASVLKPAVGPLELKGDPQHAGFHFRAAQEVAASTAGQTYYVRPDGVSKPGEYRNWPDQKDQVNFPWKGMSFVVGNQRYTAAYLDRPENPKESRFSERDYGRFGSYFETTLTEENPVRLNYRVWLQPGEMTVAEIAALDQDFVAPPEVTVKKK